MVAMMVEEAVILLEEPVSTKVIALETTVAKLTAAKTKTTVVSLKETATLVPPECTTACTCIH